jgi:LmbE family N-acetylglucosaminyl deacetylase/SAM-dependent methyltransferase
MNSASAGAPPRPELRAHPHPLLALLDAAGLPDGARVLVLGREVPLEALRARGWRPETAPDVYTLAVPDAALDAAVCDGFLERAEWDRWALQQVHRALRPGAPLVLRVANLASPQAWLDPGFVVAQIRRHAGFAASRWLKQPAEARPRFARRKYRIARLRATLEDLGYRIEQCRGDGPVTEAAGGGQPRFWTLVARREPSLYGITARPWPDVQGHEERFRTTERPYLEARDAWAAAHGSLLSAPPGALDPAAFRGSAALALAPHPDDEVIGCGGTLLRLAEQGARIHILHATDGSEAASLWHAPDAVRRTVRLEEAQRVAEAMGAATEYWRESNTAFRETEALVERLARRLDELRPALVFVPFVTDVHPDHRTLCRLLGRALERVPDAARAARVLSYQVWGLVAANAWCDVTEVLPKLEQLLQLYVTAMKVEDYVHFLQERDYHNACALTGRPGFAEAYFSIGATGYPAVAREAEPGHA